MTDYVIPSVGSSGTFQLREPFNTKIDPNVKYTCQAVRRISNYIASNEDVKADVYDKNEIEEAIYLEDLEIDTYIASLQSDTGQWLDVPSRYIIAFPSTNGIPYRAISFSVGLPAMPVVRDYSNVMADLKNLIRQTLGVNCNVSIVETSKISLVDSLKHDQTQINRNAITGPVSTDYGRYMKTLTDLQSAQQKIAELELYIKNNITPP